MSISIKDHWMKDVNSDAWKKHLEKIRDFGGHSHLDLEAGQNKEHSITIDSVPGNVALVADWSPFIGEEDLVCMDPGTRRIYRATSSSNELIVGRAITSEEAIPDAPPGSTNRRVAFSPLNQEVASPSTPNLGWDSDDNIVDFSREELDLVLDVLFAVSRGHKISLTIGEGQVLGHVIRKLS